MNAIEYAGHATVRIDLDGTRFLTDPLLRRRVAHLVRAAPTPGGAVAKVDAVLISHAHHDHLDVRSLRMLDRNVQLVVPRGLAEKVRRFARVTEVVEGDEVSIGNVVVRATRAEHDGGRTLGPKAAALGYAILGSRRIFFAGDTGLFPGMDGLVAELDVALVPIWGWGRTLGRGEHLDPAGAAEAIRRLRPKVAVPIHWGTYCPFYLALRGRPAFLHEPGEAFLRAAAEVAPDVETRLLRPGERFAI
jgi:L-ascorbate metabolism protein UlaG (beta-lactamase superfamily)